MRHTIIVVALILGLSACQTVSVPDASQIPDAAQPAVVFFSENGATLDAQAREIVSRTAVLAKSRPSSNVRVLGFASSDFGTAEYNRSLSQQRAAAVVDGLTEAGVDRARITIEPLGSLAFGFTPLESRRVEIQIGN